ncbi:MAG: hypothetical protein KKG50_07810, partial [Candidatus Omnitrophica bacterium]|nr:hypothetical protein [Candidatus Omnitrophota bacterium]
FTAPPKLPSGNFGWRFNLKNLALRARYHAFKASEPAVKQVFISFCDLLTPLSDSTIFSIIVS